MYSFIYNTCLHIYLLTDIHPYTPYRACYSRALAATPSHKSLPILMEYAKMESDTVALSNQIRLKYVTQQQLHLQHGAKNQRSNLSSRLDTTLDTDNASPNDNNSMNDSIDPTMAILTNAASIGAYRKERDAAVLASYQEARKLYELAVKRFPDSKL